MEVPQTNFWVEKGKQKLNSFPANSSAEILKTPDLHAVHLCPGIQDHAGFQLLAVSEDTGGWLSSEDPNSSGVAADSRTCQVLRD